MYCLVKNRNIKSEVKSAGKKTNEMRRRNICIKLLMYIVVVVLFVLILVLIITKITKWYLWEDR